MKKNLGKLGFCFLLLQMSLLANSLVSYKLTTNKKSAMLKEPITITFSVQQKNRSDNMFFLLTPKKSNDYEIQLLKTLNDDKEYRHAEASFTYILFPLKAKKIHVDFDFKVQTTSDQALAQSYVDDHDGGKAVQNVSHSISLKPLIIDVKKLPQGIDFFGDFTLTAQYDTKLVTQYEDVNILYTIQGEGYKIEKKSLLPQIKNVTYFKDIDNVYTKITAKGYKSKYIYTYALSSTEQFKVPSINLKGYSFTKHKMYTLSAPFSIINVNAVDPKTLLDAKDSPKIEYVFTLQTFKTYFIYSMIFLFGFTSAKFTEINFIKKPQKKKYEDITKSKTAKELLLLLINNYNNTKMKGFVEVLEKIEYKQSSQSFQEVKKEVLKVLNED